MALSDSLSDSNGDSSGCSTTPALQQRNANQQRTAELNSGLRAPPHWLEAGQGVARGPWQRPRLLLSLPHKMQGTDRALWPVNPSLGKD